MRTAMLALWLVACGRAPSAEDPPCPTGEPRLDAPFFHGNRARIGWNGAEPALTPAAVASSRFGALWRSPVLDAVTIGGRAYAPHLYASPLYVEGLEVKGGDWDGARVNAIIAATSNARVYAVSACGVDVGARHLPAGTILWSTAIATPDVVPGVDGGVALGVLSTPAIDLGGGRVYAAAMDGSAGWQVSALDLPSGRVLPGWPVVLDNDVLAPVNLNGPAQFQDARIISQRGALNLSQAGDRLYVPFGAYGDRGAGWTIAVDTAHAAVAAAFSSGRNLGIADAYGGMWGAGGVVVGDDDRVFETSGNAPDGSGPTPHLWGESLLAWKPSLELVGTYTPFNYCQLDSADADLGGASPLLVPALDPDESATPHLIAFGGKQGNVYLVDRDHLAGSLVARPPCSADSTSDTSLLPPGPQPQFGARGPLNVFGPYSERFGNLDRAKMRSTPAFFRGGDGARYLYVSGASKAAEDSMQSVPPSLARLKINVAPGAPAYLSIDATDHEIAFLNPGSPVVSSRGGDGVVVWVLDENATRLASLLDPATPHPRLYAVDGVTMRVLWKSGDGELDLGGKYSTPLVVHGNVFVGTDRIEAFGLR